MPLLELQKIIQHAYVIEETQLNTFLLQFFLSDQFIMV